MGGIFGSDIKSETSRLRSEISDPKSWVYSMNPGAFPKSDTPAILDLFKPWHVGAAVFLTLRPLSPVTVL